MNLTSTAKRLWKLTPSGRAVSIARSTGGMVAGAAAAVGGTAAGLYFLKRRRNNDSEDFTGEATETVREASRSHEHDPGELNDPALEAKVESEIFRDPEAPKGKVSVNVQERVVYLRGQLDAQEEIDSLESAAASVDGVIRVENLLHLPGEPAPTS